MYAGPKYLGLGTISELLSDLECISFVQAIGLRSKLELLGRVAVDFFKFSGMLGPDCAPHFMEVSG